MSRPGYAAGVTNEGTWNHDGLFADSNRVVAEKYTMASGEAVTDTVRGAVLGTVTANGQLKLAVVGAGDGSETPDLILAAPVDASAAAVECMAYKIGHFNRNKLRPDASIDLTDATVEEGLRVKGITYTEAQAAPA